MAMLLFFFSVSTLPPNRQQCKEYSGSFVQITRINGSKEKSCNRDGYRISLLAAGEGFELLSQCKML